MISEKEIYFLKSENIIDAEANALPLMWVYTYKFDADGYLLSYKARLIARGDLHYSPDETYAATLAAQIFRVTITIAISVVYGYKINQYDVVAAYTNADLAKPIIARLPEGFMEKFYSF